MVVDAVNFLSGELQAHFLHVAVVETFDEHQKPHALVGFDAHGQ